jgi:hypothetical protein
MLLAQTSPLGHLSPGQQACPAPPHCWQVPLTQAPPDLHEWSAQHAAPSPPQLNEALLLVQLAAKRTTHEIESARMTTSQAKAMVSSIRAAAEGDTREDPRHVRLPVAAST